MLHARLDSIVAETVPASHTNVFTDGTCAIKDLECQPNTESSARRSVTVDAQVEGYRMSELDNLLDHYRELAEAVLRFEWSRNNHPGAHEFCCDNGRCLKCEEARVRAEDDLHEALSKVAPRPFLTVPDLHVRRPAEMPPVTLLQETRKFGLVPSEYLRQFFTELEKVKPRASYHVSHAIGFHDDQLCVLVSLGDSRERVYVDSLDEDPLTAARKVFQVWQARLHTDEDID